MNKKIKLLLVEDEVFLGQIVRETLQKQGFNVLHETDGKNVLKTFKNFGPDICVFDIMLPNIDGFTLVEEIRKTDKQTPIIFLTAKSMSEDVVRGFEKGCNDYMRKPFSIDELIARIKALIKRSNYALTASADEEYKLGKYTFNYLKQELVTEAEIIRLTNREADLLKLLVQNKNSILDKKATLIALWGDDSFFNGRSMDVFITKLRKYFHEDKTIEILNVRGQGYKLLVRS